MQDRPIFGELSDEESVALLRRNNVGRIAFSFHDRVDIEPIHYVYRDGWLYGRTSPGTKLTTLAHHPWVAFEVDEVRGLFDWQSVVVHGMLVWLEQQGGEVEAQAYERAIEALRTLLPATLRWRDPAPFRVLVFGIRVDSVTGRVATTAPGERR